MTNPSATKQSSNSNRSDRSQERNQGGDRSTDKRRMKQLVVAIELGEGEDKRTLWQRVGTGFENRDGSWNLRFNLYPVSEHTTIQLRDIDPKQD